MALSAGFFAQDKRTDMGIPIFLASRNSFLMAVIVKGNVNPELLLADEKEDLLDLPSRLETP